MKSKYLLLCCLFLIYINVSWCQSNLTKQLDKRYGGSSSEGVEAMIKTSDGGLIIGGYSVSGISGDKSDTCRGYWDYWIIKVDSLGIKQWDKTFGGSLKETFSSIRPTVDGGYIIGGSSESGMNGDKSEPSWGDYDFWVVKIDSLGNKEWDKRYGGSDSDYLEDVDQTDDGGFLFSGYSRSPISGDKTQANWGLTDYWIVKTDATGNVQWDRRYGGTHRDEVGAFSKCKDGGYLIGGWSVSNIGGDKTESRFDLNGDFWIIKIDSLGNKLWDKVYGGTRYDYLTLIKQTFDGKHILGGLTFSDVSGNKTSPHCAGSGTYGDYWLFKIDSVGNILFDQDYGSVEPDYLMDVDQAADSGYVLSGLITYGANASCQKSEGYITSANGWIIKTDPLGNKEWDKTIFGPNISNSSCIALSIGSNCYAIASGSYSSNIGYNTQPSLGDFDYWLLKFCNCSTLDPPVATFSVSDTAFCQTRCVKFVDVSDCYSARQWLFPGGNPGSSTSQIPVICYPDSGYYPVTLISISPNGTDTLVKNNYITVHPFPSLPIIMQSGDTLISSIATSYQWYDSSYSSINGATAQFFIPDTSGYYYVCVKNIYGCENCSNTIYYITTGLEFDAGETQLTIKILPNPARDETIIHLSSRSSIIKGYLEIHNTVGDYIASHTINSNQEVLNVSQFPSGVYIVKIYAGERYYFRKMIIE